MIMAIELNEGKLITKQIANREGKIIRNQSDEYLKKGGGKCWWVSSEGMCIA